MAAAAPNEPNLIRVDGAPPGGPSAALPRSPDAAAVARKLKQAIVQFMHGDSDERLVAARALYDTAGVSIVMCRQLLQEAGAALVAGLDEQLTNDKAFVLVVLLTLKRIAGHLTMEVNDLRVAPPLVALLRSSTASLRRHAAALIELLCAEDEAAKSLLNAGVAPVLLRLALGERGDGDDGGGGDDAGSGGQGGDADRSGGHGRRRRGCSSDDGAGISSGAAVLCACTVLCRLAEDRDTRYQVSTAFVEHTGLVLALVAPLEYDAPAEAKQAQQQVLRAIAALGVIGEFKSSLAAEGNFIGLLFQLRDSAIAGVPALAHAIAAHWDDDFLGWAWQTCASCKQVRRMATLRADEALRADEGRSSSLTSLSLLSPAPHPPSTLLPPPPPPPSPLILPPASPPSLLPHPARVAAERMLDPETPIGPADASGGVERYTVQLFTAHRILREFLKQAR